MSEQSTAKTPWLSGSHALALRSSGSKGRSQRSQRPLSTAVLRPSRARPLGDVEANAPNTWLWGGPGSEVDAIVLMYGSDPDELARLTENQRAAINEHGLEHRWIVELKPAGQRRR